MIDSIKYAEYEWFLWLNSFHSPLWDTIMFWVTYRFTWIPLYLFIIYFLYKNISQNFVRNLLFVLISVGLADRITSGLMKPFFQRLRPCHDPLIQHIVHVVGNCGGQFGFVSSHASNSFALVAALIILVKNYKIDSKIHLFLFFWAIIVSYSRVYVGVHFPTDIVIGGLIGFLIPFIIYPVITLFKYKKKLT
ncbi:MAG: phosphatase PAP2 family protein [Emticicia sp.]|uniref:phosphatase PAP2 family protein n=1 Tax=Emticicia sp. TaxID=1930953 RepID=UPI003BA40CC8